MQRIPSYDAIDDKYCSITDSRVFRSVQGKINKGKKRGVDMSKSLFNQLQRQRSQQLVEPVKGPGRGITAMAAAHNAGAFSFASPDFHIESRGRDERTKRCEMEVLKMILVREGYVRRLRAVSRKLLAGDKTPFRVAGGSGLIDLLVQTRSSSLATVHGVTLWRDALAADAGRREKSASIAAEESEATRSDRIRVAVDDARREPFMWNGLNYLLKMCDDTDFLADVYPLVGALGIDPDTMIHNPFMMPQNLDQVPRPPASRQANRMDPEQLIDAGSSLFTSIGGQGTRSATPAHTVGPVNSVADANSALDAGGTTATPGPASLSPQAIREKQQQRDEEHVQAMAWILIREERRARRQIRRARRGGSRASSRAGSERDVESRPMTQQSSGAARMRPKPKAGNASHQGGLHPLMDVRAGSSKHGRRPAPRSPAGGMGTYLAVDQLFPGESRGSSTMGGAGASSMPVLPMAQPRRSNMSWQEQAKAQMKVLAQSLETSAWPENAGTGRMTPLVGKGKRRKGAPSRGSRRGTAGARSMPQLNPIGEAGMAYVEPVRRVSGSRREQRRRRPKNALSRPEIVALAAMTNPSPAVVLVAATVMVLLSPDETVPEDLSWTVIRRRIADVDTFLGSLKKFRGDNIPRFKIRALQPFLCNPNFDPGLLGQPSAAAAALCAWALEVVRSRPQYLEWLGAEGAEAVRTKTAGGSRRAPQSHRMQYDDSEGQYSDDMTDEYNSGDDSDWSDEYSNQYTEDSRSMGRGRRGNDSEQYEMEDDYGSGSDYSDDIGEEDDEDTYSDGFEQEAKSITSGEGYINNDDFQGAEDPTGLLSSAFGGPDEPQRYVGGGLGRTNNKNKKRSAAPKKVSAKSNVRTKPPSVSTSDAAVAQVEEDDGYGDEFEDDEPVEEVASATTPKLTPSRKSASDGDTNGEKGVAQAVTRPDSQHSKSRPSSKSRLKKDQPGTSSTEQLAFMGPDVLCSVNVELGNKLYFVNVIDFEDNGLAIEAQDEETGEMTKIELGFKDLQNMCADKFKSLLKPGMRAKLAKRASKWLTDKGPQRLQIISPEFPQGIFYQTIGDRNAKLAEKVTSAQDERQELLRKAQEVEAKRKAEHEEYLRIEEEKRVIQEKIDAQRKLEEERIAAAQAEEERLRREKAERERMEKAEAEKRRLAEEKARAEAARKAAEEKRIAEEKARVEKLRMEAEAKAKREEEERERKRAEEAAAKAAEEARIAEELRIKEEADKLRKEQEQLRAKQAEEARMLEEAREKLRLAQEAEEREKAALEEKRLSMELAEKEAREAEEKIKQERLEEERMRLDRERLEEERRLQEEQRLANVDLEKQKADEMAQDEENQESVRKNLTEQKTVSSVATEDSYADDYGDDFETSKVLDSSESKVLAEVSSAAPSSKGAEVEEDDEYALSDDEFETSGILEDKSTVSKVASEAYDEYADDFENSTSSPPKGVNASASQVDDYGDDDFEV